MVETRGSRRKSLAPVQAEQLAGAPADGVASSRGGENGSGGTGGAAAETIQMYRQQFKQRQEEEQRTAWRRLVSWVRLRWYQYEITYVPYMLDAWERLLVLAFLLSVTSLTTYGMYNLARRYLPPQ